MRVWRGREYEPGLIDLDGKQRKAKLEDGYQEAGYRTGWQVLCNSACGIVAAVAWNALFVPKSEQAWIVRRLVAIDAGVEYDGVGWCPLEREIAGGWSRMLLFGALG